MNGILLAVTALAAVNPPRIRLGVPESEDLRARAAALLPGALIGLAAAVGLAVLSGPLLDALEITPETFRIAAGLVAAVAGIRSLVWTRPAGEPQFEDWRAALWPVAFPRVLTPEVAAFALTAGSLEGVLPTAGGLAVALGALAGLGEVRRTERTDGFLRWLGAVLAMILVAAAVFLMIDGIRDV
jgi:small neutral amino acid transporter SnatA (MarC family)